MKALHFIILMIVFVVPVTYASTVTMSVVPSGNGSGQIVGKDSAGIILINCVMFNGAFQGSAGCSNAIDVNTQLTFSVLPSADATFSGLSGTGSAAGCSGAGPCTFTLAADSTISATFNKASYTVSAVGGDNGSGTILVKFNTGSTAMECSVTNGQVSAGCSHVYDKATQLVFEAVPKNDSVFTGWSSGTGSTSTCSGTSACAFTLDQNSSLKGSFHLAPQISFGLSFAGDGSGIFSANFSTGTTAIGCVCKNGVLQGGCSTQFAAGTQLTLTMDPATDSTFAGWSKGTGSAASCSGVSPCTITLNQATLLAATLNSQTEVLRVAVTTGGSVVVQDKLKSGVILSCAAGNTCEARIPRGALVVVSANPGTLNTFSQWARLSGSAVACTGIASNTCSFKVDSASFLEAVFASLQKK